MTDLQDIVDNFVAKWGPLKPQRYRAQEMQGTFGFNASDADDRPGRETR